MIFCQLNFFPLFVHLTLTVPDLATAPTFTHFVPGAFNAAALEGNETNSRLEVRTKTVREIRRM